MQLVRAQEKADALSLKRQKERTAELKKQTKEQKAQAALAKARAVLEKADTVFNMDLIQNTAALMGKVTEDETLRLKLQQAVLLGNADQAGNLAQQLLASQIAAIKLSSTNPLGGFTEALKTALDGVRSLRDELAKLGAPKVGVPAMLTPDQLLQQDYLDVLADAVDPRFAALDAMRGPINGGYSSNNRDLTATELRIFIDPTAAQYGIGVASVNNSANGNNNNYSTIQSFAGGL
jgi:delta 1-pyrroline-5-carboxylate dehydrogenase